MLVYRGLTLCATFALQVPRSTGNIGDSTREVEVLHQMMSFLGLETELTAVEIRNDAAVTVGSNLLGVFLDLVVDTPPFLNNDNAGLSSCRKKIKD